MTEIKKPYSEIAIETFKSMISRTLDNQQKLSLFSFINSEKYRRSIIGFFTVRSLTNISDMLNEDEKLRLFILDYSDLFFYKVHEEYVDMVVSNMRSAAPRFNIPETIPEIIPENRLYLNLLSFISHSVFPNRPAGAIDNNVNGSALGKDVFSTYHQPPKDIVEFLKGNAWIIAYYFLFMNIDKLDEFIKTESDKLTN